MVGFDGAGQAVPHAKIKTAASQPFYLRVVRDVSLIQEDGLECCFDDVSNLRSFRVSLGGLSFAVRLSNLYPLKPPVVSLPGRSRAVLAGRTRSLYFDERARLCDGDLVGAGWRPLRGVHDLLALLCHELGTGPAPPQQWDVFGLGGAERHSDDAERLLAETWRVSEGVAVALVCEAFAAKPEAAVTVAETARAVFGQLQKELRSRVVTADNVEQHLREAIAACRCDAEWVGVSVCVAVAMRDRVVMAHVGNVTCHLMRTNSRQSRCLTPPHDGFDAGELARLPDVPIVKHGAATRYFADLSLVSRCLGLTGCSFVSRDPVVASAVREARDSVLLLSTAPLEAALSAQELASHLAPRVSAAEMAGEVERISRHRGATGRAFVLLCF